jgi:MFS family permease
MTNTLSVLALLVAAAAAVRSTWSPCGLSMLSTITPFGERGRGHRYGATCGWFVVGAALGGLALGGLAATLAFAVNAAGASTAVVGVLAMVATLVAVVSDSGLAAARLPVHFRQVNERWLDAYRPWVYGAGFGFQIGCGLATYITTAAVYLTVVLAALTAKPLIALMVGILFGLVRGLAVGLTRNRRTPTALLGFHHRFALLQPWADRAVMATLAMSAVVLSLQVGPIPALAVALVVIACTVVVRFEVQPCSAESEAAVAATSLSPSSSATAVSVRASASKRTGSGRLSRQRR